MRETQNRGPDSAQAGEGKMVAARRTGAFRALRTSSYIVATVMKRHEFRITELAMRAMIFVQRATRGDDWLMTDVAEKMQGEFGISRATAFRMLRTSMDVLSIGYENRIGRKPMTWRPS